MRNVSMLQKRIHVHADITHTSAHAYVCMCDIVYDMHVSSMNVYACHLFYKHAYADIDQKHV